MGASRTHKGALAVSLAAASVVVLALGLPRETEPPPPTRAAAAAKAPPVAPRCHFEPGETAAFELESTVRDVRGEEEDHFRGTLSWEVVEQRSATGWRLRAALSDVSRSDAERRIHRSGLASPRSVSGAAR